MKRTRSGRWSGGLRSDTMAAAHPSARRVTLPAAGALAAIVLIAAAFILAGCKGPTGSEGSGGDTYAGGIVLSQAAVTAADLEAAFAASSGSGGAYPGAVTLSSSVTGVYGVVPAGRELQVTRAGTTVTSGQTLELKAGATLTFIADNAALTADGAASGTLVKAADAVITVGTRLSGAPLTGVRLGVPYVAGGGSTPYLAYGGVTAAGLTVAAASHAASASTPPVAFSAANLPTIAAGVPAGTIIAPSAAITGLTAAMIPADGELILTTGTSTFDAGFGSLAADKTLTIAGYITLTSPTHISGAGTIKTSGAGYITYSSAQYKAPGAGKSAGDVATAITALATDRALFTASPTVSGGTITTNSPVATSITGLSASTAFDGTPAAASWTLPNTITGVTLSLDAAAVKLTVTVTVPAMTFNSVTAFLRGTWFTVAEWSILYQCGGGGYARWGVRRILTGGGAYDVTGKAAHRGAGY
jgi:hypothetical protein